MSRTWRTRAQLLGGLILILLAGWIVITGGSTGSSSEGTASSSGSSATHSATSQPHGSQATPDSGLPTIEESGLPPQGRETLELIRSGGPFPHDRDGITFGNREGILPARERGYYREYTVPTPGLDHRGARRIVGGGEGDRYYTDDHYSSFRQIREGQ